MVKLDIEGIIDDFPTLNQDVNGHRLAYLDSAATTQRPIQVLDAMAKYNKISNGNPHRGAYQLSIRATEEYDFSRQRVKEFINAREVKEIIFTRNTTESLNLIANSYGMEFVKEGDEIVLSISEHHSNILPWQRVARQKGAVLKYMYLDDKGRITDEEMDRVIGSKTKIVAIAHMSNVLGTIHPIREIVERARRVGATVVVDGAQAVPHMKVDVRELDADFYVFSGHKMLGPMGIGVLYGKRKLLEDMPPYLLGGDMIEYVTEQDATFAPIPHKFEAGTQNVEGAVGLGAAIEYIEDIGLDSIRDHEMKLMEYTLDRLLDIPYVGIQGPKDLKSKGGIISFTIDGVHPHDVSTILDAYGVAIRSGHHCAQPLMKYMGLPATSRLSFYLYNTKEDVDQFIRAIKNVRKWLGYGA
ncbi:MAG TPA: cysteine desulfurase [Tepidimicrobium sp.]|nr:cysteine desulfurase [Tepidimicrobium sp.]